MENKAPLVSIISGYYNRENFVDESVASLVNQRFKDVEIIIFDDCSTDGTYDKLKAFEAADPRVKVIRHQTNKGFVRGMIEAISIARGEFIAVHGSGDLSMPDRIEKQVEALLSKPNVGVVGSFIENIRFKKNGETEGQLVKHEFEGNGQQILLKKNIFSHGEVMYRKSLYHQVGGYRELFKFAQDRDLWCRMSKVCDFYVVPHVLYKRFSLPDGASFLLEKVLVQRVLSEFAIQNHELSLEGVKDLVARYGSQALFFFDYNNRFIKNAYPLALRSLYEAADGVTAHRDMVKHLVGKYSFNRYATILNLLYFFLPEKFSKWIVKKKLKINAK